MYAAFLALLTWFSCAAPLGTHPHTQGLICKVLDWPVATVGQLFPRWYGVDVFYGGRSCDFCKPIDFVWSHTRLAVPVYVVLFYLPNFVVWIVRRFRNGRSKEAPAVTRTVEQT
jgi:hypothetical protein